MTDELDRIRQRMEADEEEYLSLVEFAGQVGVGTEPLEERRINIEDKKALVKALEKCREQRDAFIDLTKPNKHAKKLCREVEDAQLAAILNGGEGNE